MKKEGGRKFVDLWLKKKNKKTGVLLNFKGLRRLLGKRQRLLAYLARKIENNKNKDMSLSLKRKDLMIVNMGPQHPSMHGVLRLIVTLDGEDVIDCEPILGSIIQYLPYVTQMDYLATMFTEAITVNAPEFLENIQIPKRASYIRVIMLELSRIASHLLWLGPFMADLGAQTPFFYIFRERELIYDLFEAATGMRMIRCDLPYGWMDKCLDFCDYFLQGVVEYQELITQNPILLERVEGVGFIRGEEAVNWGLSGPMLRASGIQWDLLQWQKEGDSLARYLAVEKIPGGPYENLEAPTRSSKGELGIYLVGDDSLFPWRWKIRPPGFINLQILPQLVKKNELADIMTILGSIDIIMGKLIVEMIIDWVEKYPHRYNNVLFFSYPLGYRFVLADLSIGLINLKNEGLGTLKIPHELMPNSFHLLIDEINSEASSTSKYGFFGWNLWRQPIGFLVIKPNILVLNMVYFILFLT
ncbi:hypothetical protein ACJX0J_001719 [Zea mays]